MKRGDVYWADLAPRSGSEQQGRRPVIVISHDAFNQTQGWRSYDREVIHWMRRGKSISKAIAKANEKYPTEALQVDNENLADVQAHYEYLADHDAINEKLDALKRIGLDR